MDIKINKILDEFIKQSNENLSVDEIILFGSYARGNERADSDIDIAVIGLGSVHAQSGHFLFDRPKAIPIKTNTDLFTSLTTAIIDIESHTSHKPDSPMVFDGLALVFTHFLHSTASTNALI